MHGTLPCEAVVTCSAKLILDNSPPDATLLRGSGPTPAWPATKNSTVSSPLADASQAFKATLNWPPLKDKRCISRLIFLLSIFVACIRFWLNVLAAFWKALKASCSCFVTKPSLAKVSSSAIRDWHTTNKSGRSSGLLRYLRDMLCTLWMRLSNSISLSGSSSAFCK